jgi:amidophosphoribosyltransferase
VFGVYAPGEDVATLTYFALFALQHRGQESAGIAVSDGARTVVHREMGLVSQVFGPSDLAALDGHLAVGHCRYSTTGSSSWENAQPVYRESGAGTRIALGHNGNLVNTAELAARLVPAPGTDSELMTRLIGERSDLALEDAIVAVARELRGAFSVVVSDERRLYAFRDPNGLRPLQIGRLPGWRLGVRVGDGGARHRRRGARARRRAGRARQRRRRRAPLRRFAEPTPTFCLFEWVYLARPDHRQDGASVLSARRRMGERLAVEAPTDADVVIPVPEAGRDAAAGYAAASGIPFADGLVKNRYVGRTFIQPTQSLRQLGIRLKLSPVREVVEGKRLVVVDDSIVRGNTSRQLVAMLRAAGAAEVHLRITSPPITDPCYYGIDMASRAELIGADMDVEQIRAFVGADSAPLPLARRARRRGAAAGRRAVHRLLHRPLPDPGPCGGGAARAGPLATSTSPQPDVTGPSGSLGLAVPAVGDARRRPADGARRHGRRRADRCGGARRPRARRRVLSTVAWVFNFLVYGTTSAVARALGAGDAAVRCDACVHVRSAPPCCWAPRRCAAVARRTVAARRARRGRRADRAGRRLPEGPCGRCPAS